jgi:hypothetical protein
LAYRTDRGEFRTWDPDRGWELIWEGGEHPMLYRMNRLDGVLVRFSVERVSEAEVVVTVASASEEVPEIEALITEALTALRAPLAVRF